MNFELIRQADPQVADAIELELERQRAHIELIASENFVSPAVLEAMGTPLTNKYAEGYPGKRYYGGCQYVDVVENLARERACRLFGAEHANVQPHSGAQANMAVYFAMLEPGDTVMGMNLSHGGHLTHGSPVNMSGKYFKFVPYGVDPETETINYEEMRRIALECKPKMIVSGASAYPRIIDFSAIRAICDEVGALMMVDIAHIAGLVAAGLHPSPVPYADFVTTTTHKTLRGPRGGMILCKEQYAKAIDKAIFPARKADPWSTSSPQRLCPSKRRFNPVSGITRSRSSKMPRPWRKPSVKQASRWSPAERTITCCCWTSPARKQPVRSWNGCWAWPI